MLTQRIAIFSTAFCLSMLPSGGIFAMQITTPAFIHNGNLPSKYTCEGPGVSPELNFQDVPANTKSLVLIVDDPDAPAGTWTHWILYNLPAHTQKLIENVESLPLGTVPGKNSWNKTGYGSPCPPSGTHRYVFKLYALDTNLELQDATSEELSKAMQGHIIKKTEIIGKYAKMQK